jgi:hypothetical protein
MSNLVEQPAEIFILKWRGNHKPRTNRIQYSIRQEIDNRIKRGQIVFVMTETEDIYEWRQWSMPVFTSWQEFMKQYRDYTFEVK